MKICIYFSAIFATFFCYGAESICLDKIRMNVVKTDANGKLDNGASKCEVSKDENGKVTLTEHFEWASRPGEFGTNIFKEL